MDPINYALNVQSPVTSLFQGINQANNETLQGQQIQQNAFAMQQAQQAALQQQQALQQQAAQRQQQQQDVADLINNPNPTAKDFVNFQLKYPQFKDSTQAAWGNLSTEIKQQRLQLAGQVVSSLDGGDKDTAVGLLEQAKQAAVNSGDKAQATALTNQIGLVKNLPAQAARNAVLKFMATVDPDNFEKNYSGLVNTDIQQQKLPAELQKTQADIGKTQAETAQAYAQTSILPQEQARKNAETQSQINDRADQTADRRNRLSIDQAELQLKIDQNAQKAGSLQLPESAQKLVNDATVKASDALTQGNKWDGLASQFSQLGGSWGALNSFDEAARKFTGNQNARSMLQTQYVALKNSEAIKSMPPGPASDTDVKNAMAGFPPETADPEQLASFMRGVAKMSRVSAAYNNAQGEWVSQNGYLGAARNDMNIQGVKVSKGSNFTDWIGQAMKGVTDKQDESAMKQQIQGGSGRSYLKYGGQ